MSETRLHKAVKYGTVKMMLDLLSKGVDVNSQDAFGYTALHFAASFEDIEKLNVLLSAKANVNIQNRRGETPLYLAIKNRRPIEIIEALMSEEADLYIKDCFGNTVFDLLDKEGDEERKNILKGYNIQKQRNDQLLKLSQMSYEELIDTQKSKEIFENLLKMDCLASVLECTSIDSYDKLRKVYQEVIPYAQENSSFKKQIQNTFIKAQNRLRLSTSTR